MSEDIQQGQQADGVSEQQLSGADGTVHLSQPLLGELETILRYRNNHCKSLEDVVEFLLKSYKSNKGKKSKKVPAKKIDIFDNIEINSLNDISDELINTFDYLLSNYPSMIDNADDCKGNDNSLMYKLMNTIIALNNEQDINASKSILSSIYQVTRLLQECMNIIDKVDISKVKANDDNEKIAIDNAYLCNYLTFFKEMLSRKVDVNNKIREKRTKEIADIDLHNTKYQSILKLMSNQT